jgi:cysteinyl-tRNA synthetase
LEDKGYTYKTSDGIYFDTSKFKDYGKLSRLKVSGLEAGKRTAMREKKNPTDFALWKFSKEADRRQQEWTSPWGIGFPGWHIECSTMSMKYLGEHFDIHTGGEDHIPIHHPNEIAQSEAATGKKFVNFWLHGAFLTFKRKKVSKSTGGLYTVLELEEQGFKSLAFRYFNLGAHYRTQLEFSLENLQGAQNAYVRLKNIISDIEDDGEINEKYLKDFEEKINDDLNMPEALAVLWNLLRDGQAKGKYQTIKQMDEIFGLDLMKKEEVIVPSNIKKLIEEREKYRKEEKWLNADKLRAQLLKLGYDVEDTVNGPLIKRKID